MQTQPRKILTQLSLIAVVAACASRGGPASEIEPVPVRPLEGLLAQPLILLPVQYLRGGDSAGWSLKAGEPRAYLAEVDSALEATLRSRSVPDNWIFPPVLAATAQRNRAFVTDPYQLAAQRLRPPARLPDDLLPEPLASQLRAMVELHGSRVALLPVELRFEGTSESVVPVVRLVLIDARLARVRWAAEVRGDSSGALDAGLLRSLSSNIANLIIAP